VSSQARSAEIGGARILCDADKSHKLPMVAGLPNAKSMRLLQL
jgi:hypothetical protein